MKAVILDRDGTIIPDFHYLKDPEKVAWIPGADEALKRLSKAGYSLFVASNQSAVARGLMNWTEFYQVHTRFMELVRDAGVRIEIYGYCFHDPSEDCNCRKPRTGLVLPTWRGQKIDFSHSFTMGDKLADVQLGNNLGAQGLLVLTGHGENSQKDISKHPQIKVSGVFPSIVEATDAILSR